MFGAIAVGIDSALSRGDMSKFFGGGKKAASGGVQCFFFSSRRRHTRFDCDWSSDVCSSDLQPRRGCGRGCGGRRDSCSAGLVLRAARVRRGWRVRSSGRSRGSSGGSRALLGRLGGREGGGEGKRGDLGGCRVIKKKKSRGIR